MPFQYTPYRNQYVGSMTDLMGRGRDAEAQALITAANAQAQAAQVSGQAWGGALQGIGNTIAAIPGQMQAQQDRDRVMEQRERDDQARVLRAETYAPPTIGSSILPGTPSSLESYAPSEDAVSLYGEGPPSQPVMRPTLPTSETYGPGMIDPYRTEDANGSNIFDLEQIMAAFATAGLDPPDMSPYIAINQEITGRFDQSLLNARGIARSLLEGPEGAWGQGLLTSLGVFEANGLLPAAMLSSMRAQLQDIESLSPDEKEARLGQLLHQLTGDAAAETKFVSDDAVAVETLPGGGLRTTPVTPPSERPVGRPTAQTLNGKAVNVWWGRDGVARDRHGTELIGEILPASATERLPTPGSVGDLVVTELDLQAEQLGRPLTSEEKAATMQQVLDRNREGQAPLLPGEFSAEKIERIDNLMRSLRGDAVYRGMVEINGAWQALQASYSTGVSGAAGTGLSDIAMINSFQRMIDPGVSVREGDVNLMSQATSLLEQLSPEFLTGRVTVGSRLPGPQRARMMELGRAIYGARLKDYQSQTESRFKAIAAGAGVPFELISGGFQVMPGRWDDE
jgi:hypothetical protein